MKDGKGTGEHTDK